MAHGRIAGLLDVAMRYAPAPLDRGDYERLAVPAWHGLLGGDGAEDESVLQAFLERHPAFLPGPFSVDGESGHGPWPSGVIRQPDLPSLTTRKPDFMWIATDSESLYPILIEIETPAKRWFTGDGRQHSDLTKALDQLTEWKRWFAAPDNQAAFLRLYQLPGLLRERTLRPRYVLIHGRRAEFENDRTLIGRRAHLARGHDERLMSFDRLTPNPKARDLFCADVTERGFTVVSVPPTYRLHTPLWATREPVIGLAEAIATAPDIAVTRKEFVIEELRQQQALQPPDPPIYSSEWI